MTSKENPIDVLMPIRTPRLLIRPKQQDDAAATVAAVLETWDELHQWMAWAERPGDFTLEQQELRIRQQMQSFRLREEFVLLGIEIATGQPVIWCGFHDMDWKALQCDTGCWVRKSAHGRGFATEVTNALVRYALGALRMRRVCITHSEGNLASRRMIEKLGFTPEGIQKGANRLPGGRIADRYCYARVDVIGLPSLEVQWGGS